MERCFVMLKPGVVNRRIVGEIISRLEKKGLSLIGMKMMNISEDLASRHYVEHKEKSFFKDLTGYITSGPVVAMVWEADNCVQLVRKLVGATKVEESMPGTIRGDYSLPTPHNVIHASDSDESATREINLFFKEDEIIDWHDENAKWF
jgi:nucleoside-diphosphate kinase